VLTLRRNQSAEQDWNVPVFASNRNFTVEPKACEGRGNVGCISVAMHHQQRYILGTTTQPYARVAAHVANFQPCGYGKSPEPA
jgi:hypothetical protein